MVINYPGGINKKRKTISFSNRGMDLESIINKTNEYYISINRALIYKKPTPIKIVQMDKEAKHITSAYFEKKSTTDYNGVYKGLYLDFEAKSTASKTSFPINNFQNNQLNHFKRVINQKGFAFVIIEFSKLEKYYLIKMEDIFKYLEESNKKSIPLQLIKEKGMEIKRGINPPLNYLDIIDVIF